MLRFSLLVFAVLWTTGVDAKHFIGRAFNATNTRDLESIRDVNLSNGERLSRGLTPKKPRRAYDPTRVHPAKSRRSGASYPYVHVAAYYYNNNALAGYLYTNYDQDDFLGLTQTQSSADSYYPVAPSGTRQQVAGNSIVEGLGNIVLCVNSGQTDVGSAQGVASVQYSWTNSPKPQCAKNAFDVNGVPGPIIGNYPNADLSSGVGNFYYQPAGYYAGDVIWLADSAASINAYIHHQGVQESDRVTFSFLSS